jgi:hypothetical protein
MVHFCTLLAGANPREWLLRQWCGAYPFSRRTDREQGVRHSGGNSRGP